MVMRDAFSRKTLCFYIFLFIVSKHNGETEEIVDCAITYLKAGNGAFSVPKKENCDFYNYVIETSTKSSIISVVPTPNYPNDTTVEDVSTFWNNRSILVVFKENTTLENGAEKSVVAKQWEFTSRTVPSDNSYFSHTPRLHISITLDGNWSENSISFDYKEVPFEGYQKNSSNEESGVITPWIKTKNRNYRPNSVYVFQIHKTEKMNAKSIDIVLDYLDIDVEVGEYLLLGSGIHPDGGPPPLFLSAEPQKKKYKIMDDSGYVVFVTASTRTSRKGFKIKWQFNGTNIIIIKPEDSRKDDVLQSIQFCIYNITAAKAEFEKSDPFSEFREELAEMGTKYAKENNLISEYARISSSQVEVFRVSSEIPIDETQEDLKDGGYFVMLKIQGSQKGAAAFRRDQLEYLFDSYNIKSNNTETRGYKIGRCPRNAPQDKWISIGFYALIPILCFLFLTIWIWKSSTLLNGLKKKLKIAVVNLRRASVVSVEENVYTPTLPTVNIINSQCRRHTLNYEQIIASVDEDSDVEVFNRTDFKRDFGQQTDSLHSVSLRSSGRQGETNAGYVDDEQCTQARQSTSCAISTE